MDELRNIVNEILGRDQVFGTLSEQAVECADEGKNMAGIACLFILAEHAVKHAVDMTEGKFYDAIILARDKKLISEEEYSFIDGLRETRNKIFHENHYANFLIIDEIAHPLSEDDTMEKILKSYLKPCLQIVQKLIAES